MKKSDKTFNLSTTAYILFFGVGILLFLILAKNVRVPVYETTVGTIQTKEKMIRIAFNRKEEKYGNRIYYYIQRDEWIECVNKNTEEDVFVTDNIHELKDGQDVTVDIEVGSISLLEAIFIKGGKI